MMQHERRTHSGIFCFWQTAVGQPYGKDHQAFSREDEGRLAEALKQPHIHEVEQEMFLKLWYGDI